MDRASAKFLTIILTKGNGLSDAAYPIILSASSQVILHRDTSYQFADGTNASSAPPYVLMTCNTSTSETTALSSKAGSTKVQVKHMHAGDSTMEVLDPNPKGFSGKQPGELILVMCAPRITDANLNQFTESAYPILLTEGSQLALKRDTSYRFGDGSKASSAAPEVVISCE